MSKTDEGLSTFVSRLTVKLRGMNIPRNFHPGNSKEKKRFKELLGLLDEMKSLSGDMAIAKAIPVAYLSEGAVLRVTKEMNDLDALAKEAVAELVCNWSVVGACADACAAAMVRELTLTEKKKKGLSGGTGESLESELPRRRFLVYCAIDADEKPEDVLSKILDGWDDQFRDAELEDYGWLDNTLGGNDTLANLFGGMYLVVSANDVDAIMRGERWWLEQWLCSLGCKTVSTSLMKPLEPTKTAAQSLEV